MRGDSVHLYLESMCMELVRDGDSIATGSGRAGPVRIAGVIDGDTVRLVDAAVPPDGGGHAAGVRRLFPDAVARRILEPSAAAQAPRRALEAALRREAHVKARLPAPAPGLP